MKEIGNFEKVLMFILAVALTFFAGYTIAEEQTQDRLEKQAIKTGIIHLNGSPYRIEAITGRRVTNAKRIKTNE